MTHTIQDFKKDLTETDLKTMKKSLDLHVSTIEKLYDLLLNLTLEHFEYSNGLKEINSHFFPEDNVELIIISLFGSSKIDDKKESEIKNLIKDLKVIMKNSGLEYLDFEFINQNQGIEFIFEKI